MRRWFDRVRFLWEEEVAPPEEAVDRDEPAGVPRPLRRATRFAVIAVVSTSLMGQIIGVRLVAPVDAAPTYVATCIKNTCTGLTGQARAKCIHNCSDTTP